MIVVCLKRTWLKKGRYKYSKKQRTNNLIINMNFKGMYVLGYYHSIALLFTTMTVAHHPPTPNTKIARNCNRRGKG